MIQDNLIVELSEDAEWTEDKGYNNRLCAIGRSVPWLTNFVGQNHDLFGGFFLFLEPRKQRVRITLRIEQLPASPIGDT